MHLWIAPRSSRIDYLRRIRASTAERNAARSAKNYALANQIRDELAR
jgi:cysteinyl-tRNA synthetase